MGEGSQIGSYATVRPNAKVWPGKRMRKGYPEAVLGWGNQESPPCSASGITGNLRGDLPLEEIVRVGLTTAHSLARGKRCWSPVMVLPMHGLPSGHSLQAFCMEASTCWMREPRWPTLPG